MELLWNWVNTLWGVKLFLVITSAVYTLYFQVPGGKTTSSTAGVQNVRGQLEFQRRTHLFYLFGLPWCFLLVWTALGAFVFGRAPNQTLLDLINFMTYPKQETTEAISVLLGLALICLHLCRRLYEVFYISIITVSYLDIVGHVMGYLYYFIVGLSILGSGPKLDKRQDIFHFSFLRWYHLIGVVLFVYVSIHHHRAFKILADLRKNKTGRVVTTGYKVPYGDWFEWVSCPHFLAEVLVYAAILIVLGGSSVSWIMCTVYVFINQAVTAHQTHQWYLRLWKDYPKNRYAMIPYIL